MTTRPYTQHEINFTIRLKDHPLPPIGSKALTRPTIDSLAFIDAEQLRRVDMVGGKASYNQSIFSLIFQPEPHVLDQLVVYKLDHVPDRGDSKVCHLTLNLLGVGKAIPETPLAILFGDSAHPENAQFFYPHIEGEKDSKEEESEIRLFQLRDLPSSLIILDHQGVEIRQMSIKKMLKS